MKIVFLIVISLFQCGCILPARLGFIVEGDKNDPVKSINRFNIDEGDVIRLRRYAKDRQVIIIVGIDIDLIEIIQDNDSVIIRPNNDSDRYKAHRGWGDRISIDGYYLTARHVIEDGDSVCCIVYKDGKYEKEKMKIIYKSLKYDIALLKSEESEMKYYNIHESVNKGDILYQYGLRGLSVHKINEMNKSIDGIETLSDTCLEPGDSGSALFDSKGNLVGIACRVGIKTDWIIDARRVSYFEMENNVKAKAK
jgi:S1-C subfamily serine protease